MNSPRKSIWIRLAVFLLVGAGAQASAILAISSTNTSQFTGTIDVNLVITGSPVSIEAVGAQIVAQNNSSSPYLSFYCLSGPSGCEALGPMAVLLFTTFPLSPPLFFGPGTFPLISVGWIDESGLNPGLPIFLGAPSFGTTLISVGGSSNLNFIDDANGQSVSSGAWLSGQVTITPEPTTIGMVVLGLTLLVARRVHGRCSGIAPH